ncbi:MAG: thiamine pyrophosphate-binding protein [Spirochaetes bacterium]|nr:MAG: thiamine pyrophosphate-binding protein [Spirochaetota bacterium]
MNGGDIIAKALSAQGVRFLFTLCGGHISPILVAAKASGIRVVDVRDEATAVFAADTVARLTGVPGVAAVTAGPGVTNTVTAIKNARMAETPLILLGGAAATVLKGRGSLQDIDQLSLMRVVAKDSLTIRKNCDILPVLRHAFLAASSGVPGPVFVECPIDLLYDEAVVRMLYGAGGSDTQGGGVRARLLSWYLKRHVDRMFSCEFESMEPHAIAGSVPGLHRRDVKNAARMIARAERPVMIVGSQSLLFPEKAAMLASSIERIGVPVYLAGMARGLLGREHPLLARQRRRDALREADLVLLAGMPCDFRLNYGRDINPAAALVAVNRDRHALRLNRRPQLAVHSDPFLFLNALAGSMPAESPDRETWRATIRVRDREREDEIVRMAGQDAPPLNPLAFLKKLEGAMDERSIIVADGGDFISSASYILRPRGPLSWLDPGVFGTLGCGAGFALGAKLVQPESEVWALFGDGALGYGLIEFDTFARHNVPVIAVVGNDAAWSQITRDQVDILHDDVATRLARDDYHAAAEGLGAKGLVIRAADEIDGVLARAKELARAGSPVLVNVHIGITGFRKGSISM